MLHMGGYKATFAVCSSSSVLILSDILSTEKVGRLECLWTKNCLVKQVGPASSNSRCRCQHYQQENMQVAAPSYTGPLHALMPISSLEQTIWGMVVGGGF